MGSSITSRGAHYRYPLVENRLQAEIMTERYLGPG